MTTAFPEWLGQIGLAHCRAVLQAHGIDFDNAPRLSEDALCRLGLNPGDSRRLVRALASLGQHAAASSRQTAAAHVAVSQSPFAFHGERRQQLTVMFCDLVGYTALSQRLDPEELRDLRHTFVTTCYDRVTHYDGHVAQDPGDALLIYFGWPRAHEDDAERCVLAALEIVKAVKDISETEPLAVHIGIATGEVVVGGAPGAGGRESGLAYGKTTNVAARLQDVSQANEILIEDTTRRLLRNAFDLTDLGTRSLEGFGNSQVWRLEGARQAAARFDSAHGEAPLSTLVGRKEQVAALLLEWQLARNGAGRAVLVRGEAGIGKSRLTEALREEIAHEHPTILRYQCSPFHLNAALHPVIAHIELAAGFSREDTTAQRLDKLERILVGGRTEAAPLLAALLSLPTDRYPPLRLSPQRQKEMTLDVLVDQVEGLARIKPVLMVVEDVHWTDPTSQELIDAVVPRLPALPIMLMLTHRSELQQPYTPAWIDSTHVTTISLDNLTPDEVVELAGNVARGKALPGEVLAQIVERADGVPLFIEELTKKELESGLLVEGADSYTLLKPLPAPAIPTTLNSFLIERLDRHKRAKELAQIGAALGRMFSYELLAAVSPRKGSEFDDELEQLTRTELVFRRGTPPDATYTFKHALVQDAAYHSLLKKERKKLHAHIADVLDQHFPQRVANEPELLAYHRTEADTPNDLMAAIPLWRKAGESALARMALQEAVGYLDKGLAIVERLPPSAERDALELSLREPLHTARLRWRGWSSSEVGVNATAILWLAQKQQRSQSLLIGLWGMWINTITQGRVAETPSWARRLLEEGSQSGNLDLLIFGHRARLSSHFYLGELHEALEQSERVLALYDPRHAARWMELTGNDARTAVGIFATQARWMLGFPDQAAELSDQKDDDARRLGNPFDIGWAVTWGAYVFDYRREPDRLLERVSEAARLGREQSIPVITKALVPMVEGLARLRLGQLREATTLLRTGIDEWKSRGGHLNVPYLEAALAEALALGGDLDGALRVLDACLDQIERPGWHERVWLPETLRLKGWVLMRQGKALEAETQLRSSIESARAQQALSWELRSATTLAELLAGAGRGGAARDLLKPVYDEFTEGFETHDLRSAGALLASLS